MEKVIIGVIGSVLIASVISCGTLNVQHRDKDKKLSAMLDDYCLSLAANDRKLIRVELGDKSSHNLVIECFIK